MKIAILGGGPAGLRAAESATLHPGHATITLFDAKPSVGRKFLVAGKGGLNITKEEPFVLFHTRSLTPGAPKGLWERLLADFPPEALRDWARGLGIETFAAGTGRVYPQGMKAAPLLRRWVARLKSHGVAFAMNHRWCGWEKREGGDGPRYILLFDTPEGMTRVEADAVILALGGGSWPQTGSDGHWRPILAAPLAGEPPLALAPFAPANCGWEIAWSPRFLAACEGQPLKNIVASAPGATPCAGELMITRYGLEGGALYQLGPALRRTPLLTLDLKPSATPAQLIARFGATPRTLPPDLPLDAARRWKLGPVATALFVESLESHPLLPASDSPAATIAALADHAKALPLPLLRPRPLEEAISTAGGLCWSELDEHLMLRRHPGVFAAGEMIDWEAPTGGYLMQGAFATGHRAGTSAARYLAARCGM